MIMLVLMKVEKQFFGSACQDFDNPCADLQPKTAKLRRPKLWSAGVFPNSSNVLRHFHVATDNFWPYAERRLGTNDARCGPFLANCSVERSQYRARLLPTAAPSWRAEQHGARRTATGPLAIARLVGSRE